MLQAAGDEEGKVQRSNTMEVLMSSVVTLMQEADTLESRVDQNYPSSRHRQDWPKVIHTPRS